MKFMQMAGLILLCSVMILTLLACQGGNDG
nr:MAG TPA: protein of unknown function (DUF4969) [Caudoviricetes sp.]